MNEFKKFCAAACLALAGTVAHAGAPADATPPAGADAMPKLDAIGWRVTNGAPSAGAADANSYRHGRLQPNQFALISLERGDVDGRHGALLFAVLSVLSAGLCLKKRKL